MASTVTKGFAARAGFVPAVTWGTPVVAGALRQIEIVSEGLTPDSQLIPDEQLTGEATTLFGDKGNEFHSGDIVSDLRYQGLETLIAQAMGTAGVPTQQGTDIAYLHVFKPNKNKEGIFGTLVLDKVLDVWEYTTTKVGGFTLAVSNGRRARMTFPMIPQGLNINTTTGTNNTTTVGTLTLPANRDFALFSQLSVSMNGTDAGAIAASDEVYINEFNITINNNYPTDDVTTRFGSLIDEPVQNGWTEITGSMTFSKYMTENRAWVIAMLAKTRWKVKVEFIGPVLTGMGIIPQRLTMYMPDVQFASAPANISGPGRMPFTLAFRASHKTTVPTGFPANYKEALIIELMNKNNLNALA